MNTILYLLKDNNILAHLKPIEQEGMYLTCDFIPLPIFATYQKSFEELWILLSKQKMETFIKKYDELMDEGLYIKQGDEIITDFQLNIDAEKGIAWFRA